jgi:hypothetical protein
MKRLVTNILLNFIGLGMFAQSSLLILTNEKVIGKNYLNNSDIKTLEYIFPERIDHSFIDTSTNLLTVQLRALTKNGKWLNNTGKMVMYDLSSNKEKWVKDLNYLQSNIEQYNDLIIQTTGNKSYSLNFENGQNQWEVKNNIYYVDPRQKIGIGYKFKTSTGYTNTLEGINLSNGTPIWKREINREYGWNSVFHLNDSVIIIVAAGLHSLNLNNGKGWDYNMVTGKKDYTQNAATNAAGIILGALTGTYMMSTGYNSVSNVLSNVLVDSAKIYLASKENIICINHQGQYDWVSQLPSEVTSKSSIFLKDSIIYLVNYGYAFMGYRQLDFGTPYLAAFNKNNGKQIFISTINGRKDQISGFKICNDDILLVFKDRVSKYSLTDGTLKSEKSFPKDSVGELRYFVGGGVYLKSGSYFNSLISVDSTKHYLFTKDKSTLVLNDDLEIVTKINFDQLYLYFLTSKNLKFLYNGNETTVINLEYKKVADLKVSMNSIILGTKLYDMQERSFLEIDLSGLIPN